MLTIHRFVNDLDRWGSLISPEERPLYAEIVSAVWGKSFDPLTTSFAPPPTEYALSYFQQLVANIISQTCVSRDIWGLLDYGGYRLRSMHKYYANTANCSISQEIDYAPRTEMLVHKKRKLWKEKYDEGLLLPGNSEEHLVIQSKVEMLMAGAIFGVILFFLLRENSHPNCDEHHLTRMQVLRWGPLALHLPHLRADNELVLNSVQVLARNCILLIRYMGSLNVPLPSTRDHTSAEGLFSAMERHRSDGSGGLTPSNGGSSSRITIEPINHTISPSIRLANFSGPLSLKPLSYNNQPAQPKPHIRLQHISHRRQGHATSLGSQYEQ